MKLLLGLLAVATWIGSSLLADAQIIAPSLFILFCALGWFFLVIVIGGKKGFAVGVGVLIFAACVVGMLIKMSCNLLSYTEIKPESFFFWLGVLASAGFALIIPSVVIVKIWKRVGEAKPTEKLTRGEKAKKIYGYKGLI